jgi:hypothetical protein
VCSSLSQVIFKFAYFLLIGVLAKHCAVRPYEMFLFICLTLHVVLCCRARWNF